MKSNITIRVDEALKQDFINTAKANGTTATALFHQWMEDYLDGCTDESTNDSTNNDNNSTNTSDNSTNESTNSCTNNDEAIAEMANRIKSFQVHIAEVEDRISDWEQLLGVQAERWWKVEGEVKTQLNYLEGVACTLPLPEPANDEQNKTAPAGEVSEGNVKSKSSSESESIVASTRLSQSELAERLGVSGKTIANRRNKNDFDKWTCDRDPIGLSWEWEARSKSYKPIL